MIARVQHSTGGFSLLSVLLGSALLSILLFAFLEIVAIRGKSDSRISDYGTAQKSATRTLYELMDLPWGDANLTLGDHADPGGSLTWVVEAMAGADRIVKITLKQTIPTHSPPPTDEKRTTIIGYKYNDF